MRHVGDDERRARLAGRHALAPGHRTASPADAARAMTALHATEPATVHLSCWARVSELQLGDVDRALGGDGALVKQLGMRRTLFAVTPDLLPAIWGSAARRVERDERRSLGRDLAASDLTDDPDAWLEHVRSDVLGVLAAAPDGLTAGEVRAAVPALDVRLETATGGGSAVSRVLRHLGLTADAVRGRNAGPWRTLRPRWVLVATRLPGAHVAARPSDGWRELVRRWLVTFGPGTEEDVVWWLGATKGIVRRALAELDAVAVRLDDEADVGWLLPDDVDPPPDPGPWVALLPVLDPTTMGWKRRRFYLGDHEGQLLDRSGNAGTTAWVDGRVVGCWVQDDAGVVQLSLLEPVRPDALGALREQARALTDLLAGERVTTSIPSPAMRAVRL